MLVTRCQMHDGRVIRQCILLIYNNFQSELEKMVSHTENAFHF